MPSKTPDTNPAAVLTAAIENERVQKIAADAKQNAAVVARSKGDDLVARAAAGKPTSAADLIAADDEARVATAEHSIAAAIHRGATKLRHEAEIPVWWAEANQIRAWLDDLAFLVVEADDAVKATEDALKLAVADRNLRLVDYLNGHNTAGAFNQNANIRNQNPVLAALDSGVERPFVGGVNRPIHPDFVSRPNGPKIGIDTARADVAKLRHVAPAGVEGA